MRRYVKPSISYVEVAVGTIAVSGPPADIPSPDVEVVDFGCKTSIWDEDDENNKTINYEI